MLVAQDVSFSYPGQSKKVLNNISLEIQEGCFTAVLGHNGSGKSTLARLFNALLLPTEGQVSVDGFSTKEEARLWDIRAKVGMIFQNPDNQIVATTVEEDVAFGPENMGLPPLEIRERVAAALARVGMQDFRKKEPHKLSGGQKQRVAIAGVLAMQPKYIIFDEATAMLDPLGRLEIMKTIHILHQHKSITPILITHFMEEAALAERVIIMSQGKIILDGSPKEIFSQVKRLKELRLDVPAAAEVGSLLREKGLTLPLDIITNDELVEELCRLR